MTETKQIQAGERTQHTPGPWLYRRSYEAGTPFAVFTHSHMIADVFPTRLSAPEEAEPNARLIAAAPELLAACKLLMTEELPVDSFAAKIAQGKRQIASAAIAKAEGQTN